MNRLFTLKQTLPGNIECCRKYPNAQVVLLDYNSTDGLEHWIKDNFYQYIEQGLLVFYKLIDPQPRFFSHSHSRNIAFRLATGNILCNVNADYHVGDNILTYINEAMQVTEQLALIAHLDDSDRDNLGRICLRNKDFNLVGGFDETFKGYGYEDIDLNMRLKMAGVRLQYLPGAFYNAYVEHEDVSRLENSYDYHHLKRAFVRKIERGKSSVLFLYEDHQLETGTLIKSSHNFPDIQEEGWLKGYWQQAADEISLDGLPGGTVRYREDLSADVPRLLRGNEVYKEVTGEQNRRKLLLNKSIIQNYQMMKNRRKSGQFRANTAGFGNGVVIRNFSDTIELR
ncbi:glycosyltransferase family 2 protein [Chitinophaga rhizophila]|uniref:Galactosyltransferase C-terminal domain-containing protein n=1 Tax=Chitinophaga rhizophila TaxID=2866212 RepID=A0ABS7GGU1_9BACT|nr:galactosyltransferase-related protein [Chitinophaga rhizophila]MBW8685994.1 hypothetical protein [Chitinophaga rhizophila]